MTAIDVNLRRAQLFPQLSAAEIARLRRFGTVGTWAPGSNLAVAGATGAGMYVVLRGRVAVTRRQGLGDAVTIVEHGPGEFLGETGQLSGRPSLVDASALTEVEALLIPPEGLRALLVSEAELGERIMRALILRRVVLIETGGGPVLVGPHDNVDMLRLQGFLARNGHPYIALDPAVDVHAADLVAHEHATAADLPLVVCASGRVSHNPTEAQVARALGLLPELDPDHVYDVIVVGAGPAGLATAVYAASEGLSVLVLDSRAPGGQAGASARIENYLGFPTGISGQALAGRAFVQAQKFGATVAVAVTVARLDCTQRPRLLEMTDGRQVRARAVVVASGAAYRPLGLDDVAQFDGRGVHYWASPLEAKLCRNEVVALVGAGNSAGQAVVFLASHADHVHMLVRGPDLTASMSRYLIERIAGLPNVTLHARTSVTGLEGDEHGLTEVRWSSPGVSEVCHEIRRLFLFIGADPNTGWLEGCGMARDDKGFLVTGQAGARHVLETSIPGVFAIGDVRAGSVKRVAAAVGEGAAAVAQVHAYLAGV
jgi:thioredoxin reductase (NADPH)